jgi:Ca2+-transporting ATPase
MAEIWHELETNQVLKKLGTTEKGLSEEEAGRRLQKYGLNELKKEKEKSRFMMFLNQFRSVLVIILIAATVFSALIGQIIDAAAILVIVVLNALFGFVQEYKAEKTIEALRKLTTPGAVVIRDGKAKKIPSNKLVPGDVVVLEDGSKIPADIRITELVGLQIDESSITGESAPVTKAIKTVRTNVLAERKNIAFMGTLVTYGRGEGVVVETGMTTEMGRIAHIIQEKEKEITPLQEKLNAFGKRLGILILFISVLVILVGLMREVFLLGIPLSDPTIPDILVKMVMTGIALAVAAIPEGLPAIVTITLALGLRRLSGHNALIRNLPSVETLGSTTVICSDKTGTLTKNEMTLSNIWYFNKDIEVTGRGYDPEGSFTVNGKSGWEKERTLHQLLKVSALCNNARLEKSHGKWDITGDPTEAALLVAAAKAGIKKASLTTFPREREVPFTSESKMMVTVNKSGRGHIVCVKGAPEKVLGMCSRLYVDGKTVKLTSEHRKQILDKNHSMTNDSLRVLGIAFREEIHAPRSLKEGLVFLGLTGMRDPPRDGVKEDIALCNKAGIKVVMITGDHANTASSIAKNLGILTETLGILSENQRVVTGEELEKMSENELASIADDISVYARVNPEHKVKIIEALEKRGHIIAMTGDGVNDAPALKNADIGIAMGIKGTDVAKEASDMILTDDNFSSIVRAVKEGRGVYDNIKKFIQYLLSSNLGEVLVVFIAMLIGMGFYMVSENGAFLFIPILGPLQLLWINILTDAFPALALGVDPPSPGIMERKPRDPKERILSRSMFTDIILMGSLMAAGTLFLFWMFMPAGGELAMTIAFTAIVTMELARVQAVRMKYNIGFLSNNKMIMALALSLVLQLLVVYTPALQTVFHTVALGVFEWVSILLVTFIVMIIMWVNGKLRKEMW